MGDHAVHANDVELVDRITGGDTEAFSLLLTKYKNYISGIVVRHIPPEDVPEMVHDVFVRAYLSLGNFRGAGEFRHWLASVAVRTCYDYWREHYRRRETPMGSLTEGHRKWVETVLSDRSSEGFQELPYREEALELLNWALDKLSPEDRMVLELVYLQEYSIREAAALLGWSIANVKVRSFRARRKLQRLLTHEMNRGEKK